MILFQLFLAAAFFVVGELIRPKPEFEDAQAVAFEDANIPSVDPQKRIPVVFGRVRLRGSHVADVPEYKTIAIKKKVKTSAFSSKKVTIGHRYLFGIQLGLCKSEGDVVLKKIHYGEQTVWTGTAGFNADGVAISINEPDFLGGREEGGGIIGTFRFHSSGPTANVNQYLAGFRTDLPAYRHFAYIVLELVEVGESPNISEFQFEVERYPNPLGINSGADNQIDGNETNSELNPMSIVAECFNDDDWGFNRGSELDTSTFTAAGQVLASGAESNGMSLKWANNQTIDKIIDQVNKQANGVLRFNPKTGLWEYKLLRDDYVFGNLPIFNVDNIKEVEIFSRGNWEETVNEVLIQYEQRETKEKPKPAQAFDQSNFIRQGRHKSQSLTYPGCYSTALANNLASRDLKQLAFAFATSDMTFNREGWDLLPGDVFRFQWEDTLGIVDIVMRIGEMGFGDNEQTEIAINCVEDIFALATNVFADPPDTGATGLNGPPLEIALRDTFDMFYAFALFDEDTDQGLRGQQHKPLTVGSPPQSNSLNLRLWTRQGASNFVAQNVGDFVPTATLVNAMAVGDGPDLIASLEFENLTLPIVSETAVNDDDIKTLLQNIAIIVTAGEEPEIIAYEDATINGTNVTLLNVHRGLADTLNTPHSIGDRIWFISGDEIDGPVTSALFYDSDGSVDVRLTNLATTGETDVGTATTMAETFRNRVNRPYPAQFFRVNGVRYPTSPQPVNSDLELRWRHSDRLATYLRYQDDTSEPQNTTPGGNGGAGEENTEYILEIYDDVLNTLLRTVRASGGDDTFTSNDDTEVFYDYTLAKQQADGGAFAVYRAELKVENTTPGTNTDNIVDVIRVFTVIIPVNFNTRGPAYYGTLGISPPSVWPLAENTFPMEASVGSAGDATEVGEVGLGAPGPHGLHLFPAFVGDNLGAGWTGNINIADDSSLDQVNNNGWVFPFLIRCVRDAQTDRRNIMVKDDAPAAPVVNWQFGTHLDSGVDGKLTWYWQGFASTQPNTALSSARRQLDDGKWHSVVLHKFAGTQTTCAVIIDGELAWRTATSSAIGTNANFSIGGFSGQSGWGNQKMHLGMFGADNVQSGDLVSIIELAIESQAWTPWVSMTPAFFNDHWARGAGNQTSQGMQVMDWSTAQRQSAGDNDYSPSLNNATAPIAGMNTGTSGGIDSAYEDSPIIDGGNNFGKDLGGNGIRCGNDIVFAKNTQGPKELTYFACVEPTSFAGADVPFFDYQDVVLLGGEVNIGEQYVAWIDSSGFIRISIETSSNNYRVHRTTAQCCFINQPNHVYIINRDTTGWEVWVDGIEYSLNDSFATNGTIPAVDTFLNDRNEGGSLNANLYHNLLGGRTSTDDPPGAQGNEDWPGIFYEAAESVGDNTMNAADIRIHYTSSLKGFPTMLDVLLDFGPDHVFQVLDNTADDLRGTFTTLTATGTYTTDEEVPLPSDDTTMPQRLQGGERLRYTDQAMFGTGDQDNTTFIAIGQLGDDAADQTFFANHESADVSSDTNYSLMWDQGTGELRFRSDVEVANGPIKDQGDVFCLGYRQRDTPSDRFEYWEDGTVFDEALQGMSSPGTTMGEFSIGARGSGIENLNGNIHYLSFINNYTRTERIVRRAQLKYRGLNGALLEIHSHIDDSEASVNGFIYPMADLTPASSGFENYIINDASIQNLSLTGTSSRTRAGVVTLGVPAFTSFAAQTSFGSTVFKGAGTYPFTIGGWVRVDSNDDSFISVSDSAENDRYIAVGLDNGVPTIRMGLNAAEVDEAGTGTVTQGDWAFVAATFVSDTDRKLYLMGDRVGTFTASRNVDGTVLASADTVAVNRIVGPNVGYIGSYQMFFGLDKELTDAHHAVIFRETQHFGWRGLSVRDGAIAQWLLDEPSELSDATTPLFRDQLDPTYTAQATSTGVTQDVIGVLPSAPGICVEFDGSNGGIDTGYTGYPTGVLAASYECWVEPGYEGTIFSLGANTDLNAIVAEIDANGDVLVNVRGTGNERTWTGTFDTGSEGKHFVLVIPTLSGLDDMLVYEDGVSLTGSGGSTNNINITATLDLHIGEDVTDIGSPDGNGKLYGFTAYDSALTANQVSLRSDVGRERLTGIHS